MTGRLYERDGKYTVILEYRDKNKNQKQKWIATGYETKGNKKKAEAKRDEFIEQYKYLEYNENCKPLFVEFVNEWLCNKKIKSNVQHTRVTKVILIAILHRILNL